MKKFTCATKLLKDRSLTTKVQIFLSSKSAGDDYDEYEDNYTFANLNPITIRAYVTDIAPETAFWKQYGLHQDGIKEILAEKRYKTAFENANKIIISDVEYQVFKEGTGGKTTIVERPGGLIRVTVSRQG